MFPQWNSKGPIFKNATPFNCQKSYAKVNVTKKDLLWEAIVSYYHHTQSESADLPNWEPV